MTLSDKTIITHTRSPYDPAKAHEYYLRTRKLKGRRKSTTYTVNLGSGRTVILTSRELAEQKAYAAKRLRVTLDKLTELNAKLREVMSDAKQKKATSKREASKAPSAADKSKAARESKTYRDKHQQKIANKRKRVAVETKKKPTSAKDPVAALETKIANVRKTLKVVLAKQRALTGATVNR